MGLHLTGSSLTGLNNAYAALTKVATTVSVDGAAVVNKHNPVDASGGARAISLPTGQPEGTQISVEKVDASTNLVSVTGSVRGVGSSTLTLAWRYESIVLRADSAGSWWPVAGHKTKTALDSVYGRRSAVQRANRAPLGRSVVDYITLTTSGAATDGNTRLRHATPVAVQLVRLRFGNFYNASGGGTETAGPNDIVVKASAEYPSGTMRQVTFNGQTSITIPPGGLVTSDPVLVGVPAGGVFFTRTHVTVAAAAVWPVRTGLDNTNGEAADNSTTDKTMSSTITSTAGGYGPFSVVAEAADPTALCVGGVGDSILTGLGDTTSSIGWFGRALDGVAAYQKVSYQSERGATFLSPAYRRVPLLQGCNVGLCEYGINDITAGLSVAQVGANLINLWRLLVGLGMVGAYQNTITPKTTSTDSWATTGNQTVTAFETVRVGVNTWIRAGAPVNPSTLAYATVGTGGSLLAGQSGHPLLGYLEMADAVETSRNSGIWVAGGSTDGTHPSPSSHVLMAAVLTAALPAMRTAAAAA